MSEWHVLHRLLHIIQSNQDLIHRNNSLELKSAFPPELDTLKTRLVSHGYIAIPNKTDKTYRISNREKTCTIKLNTIPNDQFPLTDYNVTHNNKDTTFTSQDATYNFIVQILT